LTVIDLNPFQPYPFILTGAIAGLTAIAHLKIRQRPNAGSTAMPIKNRKRTDPQLNRDRTLGCPLHHAQSLEPDRKFGQG
jgi:hypothetical protein